MQFTSLEWWFWAGTFVLIAAALAGWEPGYAAVIVISAAQVVVFIIKTGSPRAFFSQVRIVYAA